MRVFRPVVLTQALLMASAQAQIASCGSVGTQLVGHELVGRVALLLQQLPHESQGSRCIPHGLDQQAQHLGRTHPSAPSRPRQKSCCGRRSWPRKRSRPQHDLRRGRDGAERRVRSKGVVVPTPALDDDLGLLERGEDLAVEQLVPEFTSVTPMERIATATDRPCAVSTSTWRSFATISSGLCLFLDTDPSSSWLRTIPQGGPLLRGQTTPREALKPKSLVENRLGYLRLLRRFCRW